MSTGSRYGVVPRGGLDREAAVRAAGWGGRPCPTCGHVPASEHEAVQQREDLSITWLHQDCSDGLITEEHHCVYCQPHGRETTTVQCAWCGDGPLLSGIFTDDPQGPGYVCGPVRSWLIDGGWQLDPEPLCPCHRR